MANLINECQERIGYFIEYKYLFNTWLNNSSFNVAILSEALKNFNRLMSDDYKSVYDGIFVTLSAGLSKLGENPAAQTRAIKDIITLINDIPTNGSEDYDVLGYVYEFLISNFAASAGKKAGEFYTPHEVAMVMSEIVAEHHKGKENLEIYDPTSGSGSLLITIGRAVSKHIEGKNKVKYYAQELKENTYNLTRMNLVMRGIIPQNIVTRCADTLEEDWPIHEKGIDIDKPLAVDAVVSNPPYSQHWDAKDKDLDPRFAEYGVAPKTKADYAFLLHELHHLKHDGILTIVMPHGVLFRGRPPKLYDENGQPLPAELREEGQSEGKIRANLLEKNNIDAIIGLPAGIFFGTGIPTLIMVLKKNRKGEGILFIDASKDFLKDGNQNRLRACDVKKIADTYRLRRSIPGYSREVSRDEIRRNEYNLNIPRYVDSSEPTEQYDIYATMFGDIPKSEIDLLSEYWDVFPSLREELFVAKNDTPYYTLKSSDLLTAINSNDDVRSFREDYKKAFSTFRTLMRTRLIDNVENVNEVAETDHISDDIMNRSASLPLVDPYALYQILSERWNDIMGDVEIIQTEGFGACNVVETKYKIVKKNDVEEERPDGLKGRIIPFDLVQQTYLSNQLSELNEARIRYDSIESQLAELLETLDPEEQEVLLNDDNTKWDSKGITKAFNTTCEEIGLKGTKAKKMGSFKMQTFEEETFEAKLQNLISLQDEQSLLKKEIAKQEIKLEEKTISMIKALDMKQITHLLMLKWVEPIASQIDAMPDEILTNLANRISTLSDKYAVTYQDIKQQLIDSRTELASLIDQLAGDEYAIRGLNQLINNKED